MKIFKSRMVILWQEQQGKYPVIALSFSSIKETSYDQVKKKICKTIQLLYQKYDFLLKGDFLNQRERAEFLKDFANMEEYELSERKMEVKRWYDGFKFGDRADIYNPWSIINYLRMKKAGPYWVNTSSNNLVWNLIGGGTRQVKETFEKLLAGDFITTEIDEQLPGECRIKELYKKKSLMS